MAQLPFQIEPSAALDGLQQFADAAPIHNARWYHADQAGAGLVYDIPRGALEGARYLTLDILCEGREAGVFVLELQEGADGPTFRYFFAVLPEASARLRVPMDAVNMNRWMYPREGALLKPRVGGERVNPALVDRMRVMIVMKGEAPVRWCMTPVLATTDEPLLLDEPLLTRGALLDELGQSNLHDWPGKTRTVQDMIDHLQTQLAEAPSQRWPEGFSRWGGWLDKRFEATGFFRTEWDAEAGRWWLVDPEGCAFWSAGQDCVHVDTTANYTRMENALGWLPDEEDPLSVILRQRGDEKYVNYLQANLMRAFGAEDWHAKWAEITLAELRRAGINTVANWSEWQIAREAGFPYVRPLNIYASANTPTIYRELPDVFDPQFDRDAAEFAQQLAETRDDPALVGYFMMNEPTWGFAQETPAEGMMFNTITCASRYALADFLRERYSDDDGLSAAWGMDVSNALVEEGEWTMPFTEAAKADLADFSAILVEKYFGTLSAACKTVDPNHLNLGIRYHTVPPHWAVQGMRSFDVFSINCYRDRVPADDLKAIHELLNMPTMIGEWHMGALDVGLPATGVGPRVCDQAARGQAYRVYLENAAAIPHCVGVHHFTHYDQSALGRFDGETYNIGFYDVCNQPYTPLVYAARAAHEKMYSIALDQAEPFNDAPEYLPRFFY